jgi:hypothetical protein
MWATQAASALPALSVGVSSGSMTTWLNTFGGTSTAASSSPTRMHDRRAYRARNTECI